ncbi:50S ribosomal protein L16 domain protein [Onchocerca flexuosa]|uniref:50S ribosomal protein L16 domain protein n=1 Tax=Onchocerca flexuosa TaxID=387005 RepID=A0A238BY40_9BILA|nr:50S ribosomal protein L16 domain protein [Onchocerca flexuosa]
MFINSRREGDGKSSSKLFEDGRGGIKRSCSGRTGGAERARTECCKEDRLPLRANTGARVRKGSKGSVEGSTKGGSTLSFGDYGLKTTETGRILCKHSEAVRRVISGTMKRSAE